jgi:hypothetical protein
VSQAATRDGSTGPDLVRGSIGVFISLAGVACSLTVLFLAMRAVMNIGGFCAEGGPFLIEHHCPKGVPLLMMTSIWGGLIFAGLYAWQGFKRNCAYFIGLLWPALFISLGVNFLQYGIDPPAPMAGPVGGWLVCGVLFVLMGGAPLIPALSSMWRHLRGHTEPSTWRQGIVPPGAARSTAAAFRQLGRAVRATDAAAQGSRQTPPAPGFDTSGDLVMKLERLDALHRSGALSDDEYEAAKQRIIEGA